MIDWGDILETSDHKTALAKLYDKHGAFDRLADYLGVSKNALRAKMAAENIPFKPKGGMNPSSRQCKSKLDSIPLDLFQTIPPRLLAQQFKMDITAVYKYMRRRGIKREVSTREVDDVEETTMPSEGGVGSGAARVQPDNGESDLQSAGELGTTRKA